MTAVAKKLLETPMAPYSRLLQGMSREDKKIVIMFLTESLAESAEEAKEFKLSKEERKRGLMSLAGCWKDDPEDAAKMEAAIKDGRIHNQSYSHLFPPLLITIHSFTCYYFQIFYLFVLSFLLSPSPYVSFWSAAGSHFLSNHLAHAPLIITILLPGNTTMGRV